jgi:hypothetical protein
MSRRSRARACLHRPPTCAAMSNACAESGASRSGLTALTPPLPREASPREVARDGVRAPKPGSGFRSRPLPALPTLPASAPQHGNSPFRGRATPAFALTLPVPWTSPLRRTEVRWPKTPHARLRPCGRWISRMAPSMAWRFDSSARVAIGDRCGSAVKTRAIATA